MAQVLTQTQTQEVSTPRISIVGDVSLLDLPVEIRLNIYSYLFHPSKVVLNAGNPSTRQMCLVPDGAAFRSWQSGGSSQLLRVCKKMLHEARPLLYANTIFHIITHTFAGGLPSSLSNDQPIAKHVRHLVWQLDCDILKKYYPEEFAFHEGDLEMLDTLEIRAKVDTWKGSFCGEDCDRDGFVRGRNGLLEYGKLLLRQLQKDARGPAFLVEDQRFLGKGEARIQLCKGKEEVKDKDSKDLI